MSNKFAGFAFFHAMAEVRCDELKLELTRTMPAVLDTVAFCGHEVKLPEAVRT
jgi:hypothetical protein